MTSALRISLSQPYDLVWNGITYNDGGILVDPRNLFVPQFQLVAPGGSFAAWVAGTWDANVPAAGPFAARITIGPGQPTSVNPAAPGAYTLYGRFYQSSGETPTFGARVVILEAP